MTSISLVLLITLTVDTKFFYIEQEEVLETYEKELEELKEGKEGRNWIKLLLSGGTDYLITQNTFLATRGFIYGLRGIIKLRTSIQRADAPLFIKYCCLKIHLA